MIDFTSSGPTSIVPVSPTLPDWQTIISPEDARFYMAMEDLRTPLPPPDATGLQDNLDDVNPAVIPPIRYDNAAIAIARGLHQSHSDIWHNLCLMCVRLDYGMPAKDPTALAAWNNAQHKFSVKSGDEVPRGYPVFWGGGDGHVAIAVGGGYCWTTDFWTYGGVDLARIDLISERWAKPLLGYTHDLEGVDVVPPDQRPPKFPRYAKESVALFQAHKGLIDLASSYPHWTWVHEEAHSVWEAWQKTHAVNYPPTK